MQIEDLAAIVLDPNLGTLWPEQMDKLPEWRVGRKWRVEYVFSSPAVPLHALALGNEVRGIWRYEVIGEDDEAEPPTWTLRVSPERRGAEGYHFIATYRKKDLGLISAKRFEGEAELPFELRQLPPLDQAVSRSEDGLTYERNFMSKPPDAPPEFEPEEEAELFEGAEIELELEEEEV